MPQFIRALLLLLLAASPALAADNASIEAPAGTPVVGERLVFDVVWMGIPVGTGTLELKEKLLFAGRPAYHVIATARTNDFFSKIYAIDDEVQSYFDAQTGYSLEFSKRLKEGRYRADERIVFDPAQKKAFYESFLNKSKKELPIEGPVHDLLSAFYRFRLQPVRVGDKWRTTVSSDEKNWDLEMDVLRIETKHFRKRPSVRALLVEPKTRLEGVLYNRGRSWVHFSTDRSRTPVWITIHSRFGAVLGVLRN